MNEIRSSVALHCDTQLCCKSTFQSNGKLTDRECCMVNILSCSMNEWQLNNGNERSHLVSRCHSGFRPPGPNPLADMDSPSQIWTPLQTVSFKHRLYHTWSLILFGSFLPIFFSITEQHSSASGNLVRACQIDIFSLKPLKMYA